MDITALLESQMSKNEFRANVDFVTLYNGQYWEHFFSSNYLNYSIELVSHNNIVTLNPTKTTVSVDNLVLLESQMSENEFQESVDLVTKYNA
eukprot:scaffold66092_cov72-Attheya_sp.AAC.1